MTLLRDCEVNGHRLDVRIADGLVAATGSALIAHPGEEVIDAAGGALLPGLTDHHLHLHAIAATRTSIRCGHPQVSDSVTLAATLAAAPADAHGWVRGVGYHETVAGDLDAAALTTLHPSRPTRVQHRSGALWIVNTLAVDRLGLATADHPGIERDRNDRPTGRLWRADDWLRDRLPRTGPPDLAAVGAQLAGLGITAVTDATPDLDPTAIGAIAEAVAGGALPQRVHLMGVPLDQRAPTGIGSAPYKIVLADSGLPVLDDLAERIRAAHAAGRPVGVHCVTREALVLLLAAFDAAGVRPCDRIEHAALVPVELIGDLARRGLRVVTQPGFLLDRGDDYLRDVPVMDHPDLYRCRSLTTAGITLALSSDAPYGPLDPFTVVAAASERRTATDHLIGPAERLDPRAALDSYLTSANDPGGRPRRVRTGMIADLVLLDGPLADVLTRRSPAPVRATWIGTDAPVHIR